jgi:ribonuclease-3
MAIIREITTFSDPMLDVYARLTEGQLKNRAEPEKGLFIAESPNVIDRALDGGYEPALSFIERELFTRLEEIHEHTGRDYKTDLQEKVQAQAETVRYDLIETAGPPHNRRFTMQAVVADKVLGQGIGKTKKEAEQQAAKAALEKL